MYGLPEDFDVSIFVGRELVQVSFTTNTVHLAFGGDVAITTETSFVLRLSGWTEEARQELPVESSNLMALIGHRVRLANAATDGTLTLHFEGGGILTFVDDSKEYESYHIHTPDREIVV